MKRNGVFNITLTQHGPELHSHLRRQRQEIISQVLSLSISQPSLEDLGSLHFLNKGRVVIDAEAIGCLNLAMVKNIFDSHLSLIVLNEVSEGHGSLKANKSVGQVVDGTEVGTLLKQRGARQTLTQPIPRPTRRINLVRLKVIRVLKVLVVLVNEVPDNLVNVVLCPAEPVFNGRLDIKDGPTIKLGGVHLTNLVLLTMFTAVDGSKDEGLRVKSEASELPRVSQLKDTLTNFRSSAVNLIKEEHDRSLASGLEPLRWVPRSNVAVSRRKTKQVTLSHLGSTALNDWKTSVTSELIDDLGLAHAVTTANQNWFANRSDMGDNGNKGFKVNSH